MRHYFHYLITAVALLALLAAIGCSASSATGGGAAPTGPPAAASSPSPAAATSAASQTVNMTDANQFQPATLTVARGTSVTWVNIGQSPHTVTDDPSKAANPSDSVLPSGTQPWDSGIIAGGGNFSHSFDTPGQYVYFCIPHEALGMIGRLTVSG